MQALRRPSSTCIISGEQIIAHLATRRSPRIVISDERAKLLDQGGGIKKALPTLGNAPFFICNTDAFWREEGANNIRALARYFDPERMDAALLLAETENSLGVDWGGDFEIDAAGRLSQPAGRRRYVYTGVGILSPRLFENVSEEVFKLSPFFFEAARRERLFGLPDARTLDACRLRRRDRGSRARLARGALLRHESTMAQKIFTIAPGVPFLPTFVAALLDGKIVEGVSQAIAPLDLARISIFTPTRRAARALAVEFALKLDRPAALLPRILPLGALDEIESATLLSEAVLRRLGADDR